MSEKHDLVPVTTGGAALYKQSTDAASICKELAIRKAITIQGRKYIPIEVWQAIAVAHQCILSARDVQTLEHGWSAIGEVRRMSDGVVLATAEGFVGKDEPTWAGGVNQYGKTLPKRAEFACRAMAQTRACSRAARSAFAHVVVLMDCGLQTTPAEEMQGVMDHEIVAEVGPPINQTPPQTASKPPVSANSGQPAETPPPAKKGPPAAPAARKPATKKEAHVVVDTVSDLESKPYKKTNGEEGTVWSYTSQALPGVRMGCFSETIAFDLQTANESHDPIEITYEDMPPYQGVKQAKIIGAKFV